MVVLEDSLNFELAGKHFFAVPVSQRHRYLPRWYTP
jgi:hypothetical protein